MEKEKLVLEIPYGTRDFLFAEASCKRDIETKLAGTFRQWGYDEVVTPTIEYLDNLTLGSSRSLEPQLLKLFDQSTRTLALRHEMTTPIARLAASRLKDEPLPLKVSYISNVFRREQTQMGRQCEFYQAGVELMGSASAAADAEVIALAVTCLREAGLEAFTICLGQAEFVNGIMAQYNLSADTQAELQEALEQRNLVAIDALVDQLDLPNNSKEVLRQLPLLNGGEELLQRAYDMALSEQSRRALDNLSEIYRLLRSYGVAQYVRFDLGIIRDLSYYTGMIFEGYTAGLGFPLCGGGRYDHLLADFGNACPATGFALGIERVMLALQQKAARPLAARKDVYLGYAAGKASEAIAKAAELRQAGKVVEVALRPETQAEAKEVQKAKAYRELVYLA